MFRWLFGNSQPTPAPQPTNRVADPGIPVRNRIRNRRRMDADRIRRLHRLSAQNRDQIEVDQEDLIDLLSLLMLHETLTTDPDVEVGFCNSYFDIQSSGEWDQIASGEVDPSEIEEAVSQVEPDTTYEPDDSPGCPNEPADVETDTTEVEPRTVHTSGFLQAETPAPIEDETTKNSGFSSYGGGDSYDSGGGGFDSGGCDID